MNIHTNDNLYTEELFEKIVGRKPEDDDLERANCPKAGETGHNDCGLCKHFKPVFCCTECWSVSHLESFKRLHIELK